MKIITKYFKELTNNQLEQIEKLKTLYTKLNQEVNTISRKDIDNLYEHHVLPALAIARIAKFDKATRVLDIGTGGGFPGIPLAIYFPDVSFTLVDSIAKKISIVQEVIDQLGLQNTTTYRARSNELKDKFDYVVGRGVTEPKKFTQLAQKNLKNKNNKKSIYYISGDNKLSGLGSVSMTDYYKEEYYVGKSIFVSP